MAVYILTEGGKNIGFGHITRCLSLYESLSARETAPQLIINGDSSVQDFMKSAKHRLFNWLEDENLPVNNTDVLVIDSYLAGIETYKRLSNQAKICVYIDDNKRLDYPPGVLVNGSIHAEGLNYPVRKDMVYLLGVKYFPLRKPFTGIAGLRKISDTINNFLITFGGGDMRNLTPGILRMLKQRYPEQAKKVVMGSGFRNTAEIAALKDGRTKVFFSPDADGMKNLMLGSDIAVSACGQTLYELAATGTPAIGICAAENQKGNASGWQKAGFLQYAGSYNDRKLEEKVDSLIKKLLPPRARLARADAGRKTMDGQGAARLANYICSI